MGVRWSGPAATSAPGGAVLLSTAASTAAGCIMTGGSVAAGDVAAGDEAPTELGAESVASRCMMAACRPACFDDAGEELGASSAFHSTWNKHTMPAVKLNCEACKSLKHRASEHPIVKLSVARCNCRVISSADNCRVKPTQCQLSSWVCEA